MSTATSVSSVPTKTAPGATSSATPAAAPIKILRPGKVVILLKGRYAGRKAFIVNPFDGNPTKSKPFSHALIVGIEKGPKKVTKSMSKKEIYRRSRVKAFIKLINYNHIMPTRYSIDIDVKNLVNLDVASDPAKRKHASTAISKKLEEKYKSGTAKWFFTKLRF